MSAKSIIVGTMTWGKWGKSLSTSQMASQIEGVLGLGLNRFDHADIYGDYTTESEFGNAFKSTSIDRDQLYLISKCGIQMTKGRPNRVKHYQYDLNYIKESAERSLKNLQVDYLDLFLLHRPSPLMDPRIIGEAIAELLREQKIKAFGLSNFLPHQVEMISAYCPVEANQVEFSLTHRIPMYDGTFDQMISTSIEAMAWSPLGKLFKDTDHPEVQRIIGGSASLRKRYGLDLAGLAMAFISRHPAGVSPVVGTTSLERLKDLKNSFELELELEDWFELLELAEGRRVP